MMMPLTLSLLTLHMTYGLEMMVCVCDDVGVMMDGNVINIPESNVF
jgi:hypothetical protein